MIEDELRGEPGAARIPRDVRDVARDVEPPVIGLKMGVTSSLEWAFEEADELKLCGRVLCEVCSERGLSGCPICWDSGGARVRKGARGGT